ncbi:MAG TPA: hypothetical protein GX521_03095 [Firmicutes bacterium]|nr:hypothetical protein [Bacillota bacterium]
MTCKSLAMQIRGRINELKSEQIMLRPFIASDQALWEALEKAISELNWVLERVVSEEE